MDIMQRYYDEGMSIATSKECSEDSILEKIQRFEELKASLQEETDDIKIHESLEKIHNALVALLLCARATANDQLIPAILCGIAGFAMLHK